MYSYATYATYGNVRAEKTFLGLTQCITTVKPGLVSPWGGGGGGGRQREKNTDRI
jgi:hypothetical protein